MTRRQREELVLVAVLIAVVVLAALSGQYVS